MVTVAQVWRAEGGAAGSRAAVQWRLGGETGISGSRGEKYPHRGGRRGLGRMTGVGHTNPALSPFQKSELALPSFVFFFLKLWYNMHSIKFTFLAIFKCAVQWC